MDWAMSVAFSPEGTRVVSGSIDKTVRVWEVSSGAQVIPPGHKWLRLVSGAYS
jgi:WD40 repeat protein